MMALMGGREWVEGPENAWWRVVSSCWPALAVVGL